MAPPNTIDLHIPSESMPPAMSPSDSSSGTRSDSPPPSQGLQERGLAASKVSLVINSVKKRLFAQRCVHVKRRMEENKQKMADLTNNLLTSAQERGYLRGDESNANIDLLSKRQKYAVDMHNGIEKNNGDDDNNTSQDDGYGSVILLGSSIAVKNAVRPIKLTEVKKLPTYTTWVFLDRNQRMTEDQSVFGRRRIYYDQSGGEALIASDSDEEVVDEFEEKKEFKDSEDYILRETINEVGLSDAVLDSLAQCFSKQPSEVKARYEALVKRETLATSADSNILLSEEIPSSYLDKDLDAALDSFDNLFCRRCLVFDCRLHGCSQDLIFPAEKQLPWTCPETESKPCGPHCYRVALESERKATVNSPVRVVGKDLGLPCTDVSGSQLSRGLSAGVSLRRRSKSVQSESATSNGINVSESSDSESKRRRDFTATRTSLSPSNTKLVEKREVHKRNSSRLAEHVINMRKKQKKMVTTSDSDSLASASPGSGDTNTHSILRKENEDASSCSQKFISSNTRRSTRKGSPALNGDRLLQHKVIDSLSTGMNSGQPLPSSDNTLKKGEFVDESSCKEVIDVTSWKTVEKALFAKGVEIFGRNSCLIARNAMNGLKTCSEVFHYMNHSENKLSSEEGNGLNPLAEGSSKGDGNENMGTQLRRRSKYLHRRGRVRRLKYTWKSSGSHSYRKRISDAKDQPCRQYNPCGCQSACGKDCSCYLNGTCCEKYCGCPRTCKHRFRGCHCAKSQCRSRQCPCFAASRECDPDVCRNCWISCGDGTLGIPWQRGDNYECRNMKLLLKQQQRVLLGRSDVSGWGAFLKKSVVKHDYLGEYTGELISHREADKRGKIYDRVNHSFLFNLNDQYVLDAYRKGDKLKFANHSPEPNCYAKVMMVAGDHRVGIFAKEKICAGEELFYDYRYEADRAPEWAKKPESSGTKKDDHTPSNGRAKKIA
ncbi:hypothetical protein ACET3Z_011071 [Daucus carota]